ncbi:MAG: VOC family protein [Pseudomonadota bacterium]
MPEATKTHGAFSWSELMTGDPKKAADFYAKVLGWETEVMPMPTGDYTIVKAAGAPVGGIMQHPQEGAPDLWTTYITVDDVDARVADAKAAGASVMQEPFDVPGVGRMVALSDPGGAVINFIRYEDS